MQEEATAHRKSTPRLMTAAEFAQLCDWSDGPKGCNFRNHPDDPDEIIWNCDGNLWKTRQWLRRRDFLHVERNIKRIKSLGGYCDCEVLFNAAGKWSTE